MLSKGSLHRLWSKLWNKESLRSSVVFQAQEDFKFCDLGLLLSNQSFRKMLVRLEYERILRMIENDITDHSPPRKGYIIIGHPGIGKSLFLFYILFRRLLQGLPTGLQCDDPDSYYIFNASGVEVFQFHNQYSFPPGALGLVDSNSKILTPCSAFLSGNIRVVQATSPKQENWKAWSKEHGAGFILMNVWERTELEQLASILSYDSQQRATLLNAFNNWGPSAGICCNFADGNFLDSSYESTVRDALLAVTENLYSLWNPVSGLSDKSTHLAFYLYPKSGGYWDHDTVMGQPLAELKLPTVRLAGLVSEVCAKCAETDRTKWFALFNSMPSLRSTAGLIFEAWMHIRFSGVASFDFHSREHTMQVKTEHHNRSFGNKIRLGQLSLPCYIRPNIKNFPLLDGMLVTGNCVYLLQATVATSHKLKRSGITRAKAALPKKYHPKPESMPWNFVWVVNSEDAGQKFLSKRETLIEILEDISEVYYYVCPALQMGLRAQMTEIYSELQNAEELVGEEDENAFELQI